MADMGGKGGRKTAFSSLETFLQRWVTRLKMRQWLLKYQGNAGNKFEQAINY